MEDKKKEAKQAMDDAMSAWDEATREIEDADEAVVDDTDEGYRSASRQLLRERDEAHAREYEMSKAYDGAKAAYEAL